MYAVSGSSPFHPTQLSNFPLGCGRVIGSLWSSCLPMPSAQLASSAPHAPERLPALARALPFRTPPMRSLCWARQTRSPASASNRVLAPASASAPTLVSSRRSLVTRPTLVARRLTTRTNARCQPNLPKCSTRWATSARLERAARAQLPAAAESSRRTAPARRPEKIRARRAAAGANSRSHRFQTARDAAT